MNKPLKYTLIGLGSVVILAAGAVAILAATFDPNKYKPEVERIAKEKTGRTLKLAGSLQLAFWPSIGAKVAGVTFSEKGSEREFVSLESAHVSLKLMPLLHGEAIVDALHLTGLKAVVIKEKDGKFNFDDLVSGEDAKKPAAKGEPKADGKAAPVFDISGVTIERSAVTYRDLAKGSEMGLGDVKLSTGRVAPKSDGKLEFSAQAKGKNPDIDAKIQLSGNYKVDLPAKAFELAKLDAKITGNAAGFQNLSATAKGDVAANPDKSEYRIAGLAVEVKGMQGKDALEAKITAPSLLVSKDTAKGDEVNAQFSQKGENRSLEATVKLAGVQGSAKALEVPKLTAEVSMASPDMPMKSVKVPVTGSLRADLEKQTANAELSSKFDESNIQAKLGLAKFSPPAFLFDVNVDKLNLDKYFPPKDEPKGAAGSGASKPSSQTKTETPVDLSGLKDLNANGKLAVGALQARGLKLANLKAEVHAANGKVDVAPHSANLYDGSVSGALSVHADNRITIKENLAGISVGPLLRDVAKQDRLEGKGNVALDVSAAGKTVEAMKKALAGNAKVLLKDGAIKGIDIAAAIRKAKSIIPGGQSPAQAASTQEKTDFSEMSASFVIKNGVAHNEDLDVKAPIFRLGGKGDIDVGESKLDYVAKATVVNTTKGQGGADVADLSGVTIPVQLSGPFDALSYKVDYASVAADLAKSKVGNRLKEQLGERLGIGGAKPSGGEAGKAPAQGGGSVGDKLRGLLGR